MFFYGYVFARSELTALQVKYTLTFYSILSISFFHRFVERNGLKGNKSIEIYNHVSSLLEIGGPVNLWNNVEGNKL